MAKFGLTLEPTKTKGRVCSFRTTTHGKTWQKPSGDIYFLGMTLYCTRNLKGNFKVGMRTEKSRLQRSVSSLQELMRQIRHHAISDQVRAINAALRGHYALFWCCRKYPVANQGVSGH